MTTQPHRPTPPAAALRLRGVHLLHLAVRASLAFGQQLLDLLAHTPEFLVIRGLGTTDLVLLAAGVGLLPGVLLVALVAGVRLAWPRLAWLAQLVVLSGLVSLVLLQALKQASWDRAWPLAFAAGGAAAWLYHRQRPARQFLTLLSPALLVVPLLFLLSGDVRRATTRAPATGIELLASGASAPIVFVVFDEWSFASLVDGEGNLDRDRLPNLAAFADGATWLRGATASSDVTELALPAILTGRVPEPDSLPSAADHPRNLFTLFADYRIEAREPITRLCPRELGCGAGATEPTTSIAADLAVVWLHLVVPAPHDARLPTISQSWRGFLDGGAGAASAEPDRNDFVLLARQALVTRSRDEDFRDFVAGIGEEGARREKVLHFGHFLLPHVPLEYLPSGRRYLTQASHLPGIYKEKWQQDPWLPVQAFHRYLLQVEYLDRLLGELFAVLRERGLFDDALVVLMADHGASFRPGQSRRVYSPENAADIAPIPLFVKAPGQTEGRVVDEPVSAVDVLPTILDLLDVEPPAELDGVSFAGGEPPGERALPLVTKYSGRFDVTPATRLEWGAESLEHAQWQQKIYDGRASLPSLELHRDLLGRPIAELPTYPDVTRPDTTRRARIDGASLYAGYDPSGPLSLAWVTGAIDGVPCCPTVAVAVGGRIAATTRAYEQPGSGIRFGALLPEEALEKGAHDLEVLEIGRIGGARALVLLGRPDAQRYRLELGPDGAIRAVVGDGDGDRLSMDGKIDGYLQRVRVAGDTVSVGGWTVDLEAVDLVDEVLLFYRGELVSRGVTSLPRENVVRSLGNEAYFNSGFDFVIPRSLAPDVPRHGIRIVAVARSGGAGELGIFYDRIVAGPQGEIVTVTDGREIPLGSPAMDGRIDHVEERDGKLWLVGWAADVEAGAPAERVIVFLDGRYSTQFRPGGERAEIAQRFDDPRLLRCGINVPTAPDTRQLLRNGGMRVVAISQAGEALELVEGGRRAPTAGAGRETGR